MQIGLVGLQYSGKTTLFNTLSETHDSSQNTGLDKAAIEVVKVPDKRLDRLTEIFNPKKTVNASIEVYDIPGLRTADDGKLRITNTFLNEVKNNDALFYVVRQFKDDAVPHPMNKIDPIEDISFLENEFLFYDLAFLENRIEKIQKEVMKTKDERLKKEIPVIQKCFKHVESEKPLRMLALSEDEKKLLSGYQLLTLKKLVVAINFDDESIENTNEYIKQAKELLKDDNVKIIPFFAKLEYELSTLDEEDREMFMQDYGITESALTKILHASYDALGLHSFFTVGEDENRAWTIKKNYTAQDAAGVIHSDFYNRFIRAEVVGYDDFMEHKTFAKCKEAGVWKLEGKDYIVQDGDILNIRHG
ncbi:MAG: redox-regulated ATPase YchF [Ignavibacteriae bacterium]|nr:MAG: redox-regulated ATPase YchF [Ignavibacteriota bacterium]